MDRSNFYNIIHLSVAFVLIFTSYSVAQTFQTSSSYAKDGAFALGILYLVFCLANLALSSYVIRLLGLRSTLIISSMTYAFFIAVNIKYHKWALYITAFLLGLGAALLWTAQGVYVTIATNKHEQVNNLVSSSTRGLMNGMFFGLFQLHQVIGNLLVSFLFRLNFEQWIIFTIMTIIAGLGTLSLALLRSVKVPEVKTQQSILNSLSILIDVRFILLIPIMCYNGLSQGFIYAAVPPLIFDKSQKFFIFAIYGGVNAFSCIFFGKLSDSIHRRLFILGIGAISHVVIFTLILTIWKPPLDQDRSEIFILMVVGLGIGDAIFSTLLYSIVAMLYGKTRPADAFACLKIFQAGSIALGFVEQVYLKFNTQTIILIILLLLAFTLMTYEHYIVVSLDSGKRRVSEEIKNEKNNTDVDNETALVSITSTTEV